MRWILVLSLLAPAAAPAADAVSVQPFDVDGCGDTERVVENRYLRVVVHVPQTRGFDKYNVRFVWGGWIDQITCKPDRVDMLGSSVEPRSLLVGMGLPEEFEAPIFVDREDAGERWAKIGVGLCRRPATGLDRRELIEAPPWSYEEAALPRGGRALRFTHALGPVAGVGYRYRKEMAFEPDCAAVRVRMALENTGSKALRTEWFAHPFAAPGGYGPDCWQEIPYRLGSGESARVEHESYPIPDLALGTEHAVWGWLTPAEIGGRWYAFGNYRTGHFLASLVSDDLSRVRVWMNQRVYSQEPFLEIRLAAGETKRWEVTYLVGRGLDALSGVGTGGALRIETDPGAQPGRKSAVRLRFAPDRPRRSARWQAEAVRPDGRSLGRWSGSFPGTAPDRPGRASFSLAAPQGRVTLRASVLAPARGQEPLVSAEETLLVGARVPTAQRRHAAHGETVLLLSDRPADKPPLPYDVVYLQTYLRWAGLRPEVVEAGQLRADALGRYRCAVVPGACLDKATPAQAAALADYVRGGGGLVCTAPLPLSSGPLADVLPVEGPADWVESARWRFLYTGGGYPQEDAMAEVGSARVHLRRLRAHPVADDLALHPDALQSIARYQKVRARQGAQVPLAFTGSDAPALVLGRCGRGRVAVFAAPVAWGEPHFWVIWGRLAEYHRKLFAEMALWAAGLVPDGPGRQEPAGEAGNSARAAVE